MTDADWGDEGAAAAPKKRRIPVWAWWTCGGGCLVMTVIAVAFAVFVVRVAREFVDPEKAWEGAREILPFDQRPEGWTAHGISMFGVGTYFLAPPRPGVVVVAQRFRGPDELNAMFDPDSRQNGGLLVLQELRAPEPGTLVVQGCEVRVLRFLDGVPHNPYGVEGGSGIRIDLGAPDRPALVQISLRDATEPVSAEQVAELLAPFDLWRGR